MIGYHFGDAAVTVKFRYYRFIKNLTHESIDFW